ncbi:MAG TPA: type II toxin-antitoxin system RelE/ParE family toxin [Humisphaera sp.]|nr:type II toxin-antitoxin system RelE/ParE family toxin [Humisphaera sp.]
MSNRIIIGPEALRDLDEQVVYIGERDFDAAERFELAVQADIAKLAQWPGFGAKREYPNPRLAGMRSWPITGFENHLIFYIPIADGIEVVRVLHGARDLDRIFRR